MKTDNKTNTTDKQGNAASADDQKKTKEQQPASNEPKGLTKEDLPDSTNESTGKMGSGTRQDSN